MVSLKKGLPIVFQKWGNGIHDSYKISQSAIMSAIFHSKCVFHPYIVTKVCKSYTLISCWGGNGRQNFSLGGNKCPPYYPFVPPLLSRQTWSSRKLKVETTIILILNYQSTRSLDNLCFYASVVHLAFCKLCYKIQGSKCRLTFDMMSSFYKKCPTCPLLID